MKRLPFDGQAALVAVAETFACRTTARAQELSRHCQAVAPFLTRFNASDVVGAFAAAAGLPTRSPADALRASHCRQIAMLLGSAPPARSPTPEELAVLIRVWQDVLDGLVAGIGEDGSRLLLEKTYRRELHAAERLTSSPRPSSRA